MSVCLSLPPPIQAWVPIPALCSLREAHWGFYFLHEDILYLHESDQLHISEIIFYIEKKKTEYVFRERYFFFLQFSPEFFYFSLFFRNGIYLFFD